MSRRAVESPDGGPDRDGGDLGRGRDDEAVRDDDAALLRIDREVFEIMSWRRADEGDRTERSIVDLIGDWTRSDESPPDESPPDESRSADSHSDE